MTTIADMALPDEVVGAAWNGLDMDGNMRDAIRAALQAMCDCGMAWSVNTCGFPALIIRLGADERKEQEK